MFHTPIVPRLRKRPRPVEASVPRCEEVKFHNVRLYLVERKMGHSRRSFLTGLARSKGFIVIDILSDVVTHVVSEDHQASSLWSWLRGCDLKNLPGMHVLNIGWFTDSMREGRPVAVETRHRIQDTFPSEGSTPTAVAVVSQYACQRRTTIENNNSIFTKKNDMVTETGGKNGVIEEKLGRNLSLLFPCLVFCRGDVFEVLAESYEFSELEGQCLAFRRAASVLKSLPCEVRRLEDVRDLPWMGEHTKAVMEDILQYGHSFEVERILSDKKYQTLKLFTSVFGVGPKTADKWFRKGLRSFSDVLTEPGIHLNRMQQTGFLYYEDISRPVSKAEARALGSIIDEAVRAITPDAILALTGGFRRGKEFGHDVDFIVTTPEPGRENSLLPDIIERLKHDGILLYCDYQASTLDASKLPCPRFEAMDHFAKCFLILQLEGSKVEGGFGRSEEGSRGWKAVRVDLVSPPVDRYAFALLGWTGSRQFERDLRRFAQKERQMVLDNHTLYDKTKKEFLAAQTEKDIFAHLGLEYIEPWQRNA